MSRRLAEQEGTLSVQGLEGEEESPYLRRQKAVTVRRRHLLWTRRWLLFFIAVVAPVGIASYFLTVFVLSSARFELRSADNIQLMGNQFVTREEVSSALGLPLRAGTGPGLKVARLSLEAFRKQVETIAWIRSAALTRIFPNRLLVQVVERTPVAYANVGGRVSLVDSEGVLLDKPESASFDFPVITGLNWNAGSDECRTRISLYQDFMHQIGQEIIRSGWTVSEADLTDAEDLKALLVQGRETLQVHFGHEDFPEHFHRFLTILPELHKSNAPIDSVDLRYRNQVVVNPQGRTPAPSSVGLEPSKNLKD